MVSVYKIRRSTRVAGIAAGIIFLLIGLALIWNSLVGAVGQMREPTGREPSAASLAPLPIGVTCISVFSIGAGALVLWVSLRTPVIHLTDAALEEYRGRRLVSSLPYSAFTTVAMLTQRDFTEGGGMFVYPVIHLDGAFDRPFPFKLEVSYSIRRGLRLMSRTSPYDTRAILQDLLPRLPEWVEVDQAVWDYAERGELPDLTDLAV